MKKRGRIALCLALTIMIVAGNLPATISMLSAAGAEPYQQLYDDDRGAYVISNVQDLKIFRNSTLTHHYTGQTVLLDDNIKLTPEDDIKLDTEGLEPEDIIDQAFFDGYFNGQGNTISGFSETDYGLFPVLGRNAVVTKLNLAEVEIKCEDLGQDTSVVGARYGVLTNKCTSGDLIDHKVVGGTRIQYCNITGSMVLSGNIKSSYLIGDISAYGEGSRVSDCFFDMDIDATGVQNTFSVSPFPDLVLDYEKPYQNCIFVGEIKLSENVASSYVYGKAITYRKESDDSVIAVGGVEMNTFETCFYNADLAEMRRFRYSTQFPGQDKVKYSEDRGTEKTTGELKDKTLYIDAGWDMDLTWDIDEIGEPARDATILYSEDGEYNEEDLQEGGKYSGWHQFYYEDGTPHYICDKVVYKNEGYPYLRADVEPAPPAGMTLYYPQVSLNFEGGKYEIPKQENKYIRPVSMEITGLIGPDGTQLSGEEAKKIIDENQLSIKWNDDTTLNSVLRWMEFYENKKWDTTSQKIEMNDLSFVSSLTLNCDKPNENCVFRIDRKNIQATGAITVEITQNTNVYSTEDWKRILAQMVWKDSKMLNQGNYRYGYNQDWEVLTIARFQDVNPYGAGFDYEKVYEEFFNDIKYQYENTPVDDLWAGFETNLQRQLLALGATGYDPESILLQNGMNLAEAVYGGMGNGHAMAGAAFWLISLDSIDYVPEGADPSDPDTFDQEVYDQAVATRAQRVWANIAGTVMSMRDGIEPDFSPGNVGGMNMQAISHYYDPPEGTIYYDVAKKVEEENGVSIKAVQDYRAEAAKKSQNIYGGWRSGDAICSSAQGVVFLSQLGYDVTSPEFTTVAGYCPLSLHLGYDSQYGRAEWTWDEDQKNILSGTLGGGMPSYQGGYANVAWLRMIEGKNALYDYSDIKGVRYVKKLINSLPSLEKVSMKDKENIEAALEAYNNLSESKKSCVSNYEKLESLNRKLSSGELKEEWEDVLEQMEVLKKSITVPKIATQKNEETLLEWQDELYRVWDAYEALDPEAQGKLKSAQSSPFSPFRQIKDALDQKLGKAAREKIEALPETETLELSNKEAVEAAREYYDKLKPDAQAYVDTDTVKAVAKLEACEAKLKELEEKPEEWEGVLEQMEVLKKSITVPKIATQKNEETLLEWQDELYRVWDAYEALDPEAQGKLKSAQSSPFSTFRQIKDALDQKLGKAAREKIEALPETETLELSNKEAVEAAREYYDKLKPDAQAYVDTDTVKAVAKLEACEAKLQELESRIAAVEALIEKIPAEDEVTLKDRDAVEEADRAYEALSDDQKALVPEDVKTKLDGAKAKIRELADGAANVQQMIEELPDVGELDYERDAEAVQAAADAYSKLDDDQKELVENYEKLQNAEARIEALKPVDVKDKEAANAVSAMIDALQKPYAEHRDEVYAAWDAFVDLTKAQKELVPQSKKNKLADAKDTVDRQDEDWNAAVEAVKGKIESLNPPYDAEAVRDARRAYDDLTDDQKAAVPNALLRKLGAAEAALDGQAADQAAADAVSDMIDELRAPYDAAAVEAAVNAYDGLTWGQKALVPQELKDKLAAAWAAISQQGPDEDRVDEVTDMLNALRPAGEITLDDEFDVRVARYAYDGLTEAQQQQMDPAVVQRLLDAEAKIERLKQETKALEAEEAIGMLEKQVEAYRKQEEADRKLDLDFADAVKNARGLYGALTDEEKAQVANAGLLDDAEEILARIVYHILAGLPRTEGVPAADSAEAQAWWVDHSEEIAYAQEAYRSLDDQAKRVLEELTAEDGTIVGKGQKENLAGLQELAEDYKAQDYVNTYIAELRKKLAVTLPVTRANVETIEALIYQCTTEQLAIDYIADEKNTFPVDGKETTVKAWVEMIQKSLDAYRDAQAVEEKLTRTVSETQASVGTAGVASREALKDLVAKLEAAMKAYEALPQEAKAQVSDSSYAGLADELSYVEAADGVFDCLTRAQNSFAQSTTADETVAALWQAQEYLDKLPAGAGKYLSMELELQVMDALSDMQQQKQKDMAELLEKAGIAFDTALPWYVSIDVTQLDATSAEYAALSAAVADEKDAEPLFVGTIAVRRIASANVSTAAEASAYQPVSVAWEPYDKAVSLALETGRDITGRTVYAASLQTDGTVKYLDAATDGTKASFTADAGSGTYEVAMGNEAEFGNDDTPLGDLPDTDIDDNGTPLGSQPGGSSGGTIGGSGGSSGGGTTYSGGSGGGTTTISDGQTPLADAAVITDVPKTGDAAAEQTAWILLLMACAAAAAVYAVREKRSIK